jgi:hypothetical protein
MTNRGDRWLTIRRFLIATRRGLLSEQRLRFSRCHSDCGEDRRDVIGFRERFWRLCFPGGCQATAAWGVHGPSGFP